MQDMSKMRELMLLPAEQRLALAEALWDSLAREPSTLPIPDWHLDIVAERLADDANQADDESETWASLRQRLESKP